MSKDLFYILIASIFLYNECAFFFFTVMLNYDSEIKISTCFKEIIFPPHLLQTQLKENLVLFYLF